MTAKISIPHKKRFEEIKKELTLIGSREANFIKVELLFFEAITIAREYGNDIDQNTLLYSLKNLQNTSYQDTKEHLKKSSQQEQVIKRFVNQFKIVLSSAIKNSLEKV